MRTNTNFFNAGRTVLPRCSRVVYKSSLNQRGVSLIELIAFLIIVGIASGALFKVYNYSLVHNVDPLIEMRALELAQAKLDDIFALKYDENTPSGGIPACGSVTVGALVCTNNPDGNLNDVDDYNGAVDVPYTGYTRTVSVVTDVNEKLISVTVAAPQNWTITLAVVRANF